MSSAPAKINLRLEITGLRPDGYHEIRSLFQMVSLCDTIMLERVPEKGFFRLDGDFGFDQKKNTVVAAVELFRLETSISDGIRIMLRKQIPLGSGLGGGSSDAASVLRMLNHIFGDPLSAIRLNDLGAQVGSDVPFFLCAPAAVVEGRGERVSPVTPLEDCSILIFLPDFSVNTAEAYRWFDENNPNPDHAPFPCARLEDFWKATAGQTFHCFNSFEPILEKKMFFYQNLQEKLDGFNPDFRGLSGSGSAYFAGFKSACRARQCRNELAPLCRRIHVVRPLGRLPRIRGAGGHASGD